MKHPIDIHVGQRIRQRRWLLGMTQQQLAQGVGIKFQQIQKYESAINRVSASRLFQIAGALNVPVGYFFDGAEGDSGSEVDRDAQLWGSRDALELARYFMVIPQAQRRTLLELTRVLGKGE